jgi:hypothetical protein
VERLLQPRRVVALPERIILSQGLERRAISGSKRVQRCEIVYNRAAESADLGRRLEFKWRALQLDEVR